MMQELMQNAIPSAYYSPPQSRGLCLLFVAFVKDSGKEQHQTLFFRMRTEETENSY